MTIPAIESAAREARQKLGSEAIAAHDAMRGRLNADIVAVNAAAFFGGSSEAALLFPLRRKAQGRKNSVKRGFRFTVEGLDGVYKLNPLRRVA
jgi:hypothetical protein